MNPQSKGTEPVTPIPFNTYALGTAALLPHAGTSTNDEEISVTCVRPDTAARLVINATAGAIQRAALIRFVTAKPGLWALFFVAMWLPAAIAVMIDVAVNGTGTNRFLAVIAAVGIVGGFIAVRVGQRQAKRRAEDAMRRADGDHWQAARWEPGERHAVRVEIASGLRLPWPLPGPTSTVNGVRNLIAMLRVAERRADAAEQQVAKVRVVLADERSTDQLRVAETREIVERWTSRADAYDNDAEMIRDGLAEPEADGETCDRPPAGWECRLPRDHDGPCPTYPDASAPVSPAEAYDSRRSEPHAEPWAAGELSGEIPSPADVAAHVSDAAEPTDAPVPSGDPWADVMPSEPTRPATLADVVSAPAEPERSSDTLSSGSASDPAPSTVD